MIKLPTNPAISVHIGEAFEFPLRTAWKQSIIDSFEKMYNSMSWREPLSKIHVPPDKIILNQKLAFAVKLTPVDEFCELRA